jgi:hypothetical protein
MEQSPLETNSYSASQIPHLLRNPKVLYRVHKSPGPYPEADESSPYTFPTYFSKVHFNIILLSTPKSSEGSLPFRFSD